MPPGEIQTIEAQHPAVVDEQVVEVVLCRYCLTGGDPVKLRLPVVEVVVVVGNDLSSGKRDEVSNAPDTLRNNRLTRLKPIIEDQK